MYCIAQQCNPSAGCAGWYLYDEPDCPNTSIGYCQGDMVKASSYQNVQTVATFLATISSKPILGIQTPSGVAPGCNGTWSVFCGQPQIDNLFSWLTNSTSPNSGFDYYPHCTNSGTQTGTICQDEYSKDIRVIAQAIGSTFTRNYAQETMSFVGQAFSWYQENGKGCSSESTCPYPSESQMLADRNHALYYANKAGYPIQLVFWYYWPDITCINTYPGCSATTNRAHLKRAVAAPFPTSPPSS